MQKELVSKILKNGTPHSRYFSDELGVPNFLLKPEQMFVIQRDVLYNTNMEKESRELYADCIQLWSRNEKKEYTAPCYAGYF